MWWPVHTPGGAVDGSVVLSLSMRVTGQHPLVSVFITSINFSIITQLLSWYMIRMFSYVRGMRLKNLQSMR
jgi:hypothetical protein